MRVFFHLSSFLLLVLWQPGSSAVHKQPIQIQLNDCVNMMGSLFVVVILHFKNYFVVGAAALCMRAHKLNIHP